MENLLKLGIDWKAILVYVVNFGLIVFILTRYVYKPLVTFLDARRKKAEDTIKEVEELKHSFTKEVADRSLVEQETLAELRQAREEIEKERKAILAEAYAEKTAIIAEARKEAKQVQESIIATFEEEIINRLTDVIQTGFKNNLSPQNIKLVVAETWKEVAMKKGTEYAKK